MKIIMNETRVMPFGVFQAGHEYDSTTTEGLTEGQAKTFVLCGAATVASSSSGVNITKKTAKKVVV